jgi:hypothetical protein
MVARCTHCNCTHLITLTLIHSGIWRGDRVASLGGGGERVGGGHPFLGERVGWVQLFSARDNFFVSYTFFGYFWVTYSTKMRKNCSKKPFGTILS